jgi:hypothetical protein
MSCVYTISARLCQSLIISIMTSYLECSGSRLLTSQSLRDRRQFIHGADRTDSPFNTCLHAFNCPTAPTTSRVGAILKAAVRLDSSRMPFVPPVGLDRRAPRSGYPSSRPARTRWSLNRANRLTNETKAPGRAARPRPGQQPDGGSMDPPPERLTQQPPLDGNPFRNEPPPTTGATAGTAPTDSRALRGRGSFHLIAACGSTAPLFADHSKVFGNQGNADNRRRFHRYRLSIKRLKAIPVSLT